MAIFQSIKLYVLIYFMVKHIEIINSTKDEIEYLLKHDGWKKLNDVLYITNFNQKYTLQQTLEMPITSKNCATRIRNATIILGCSYGNVLKTIFFIINRFLGYCESLIHPENENKNACDCTIELINIIQNLSYLATLMNGALVIIDKLHHNPMTNCNKLILSNVTNSLYFENTLKVSLPLQINQLNTQTVLNTIKLYLTFCEVKLEKDLNQCQLKIPNLETLWQKLNKNHQVLKETGNNQNFWSFISQKINILIHWTLIEKYNNLGFKLDLNTKETFLPENLSEEKCCSTKYSSNKINHLFKHTGWKNINDVNYITYSNCNHSLQDIIQNTYRYDKQLRCMTLLLGCSYANILKNILLMLNHFQNHCKYFSSQENVHTYAYNCTIELLKTIPFLTSLVTHMGGALYALDKFLRHPVEYNYIKTFIVKVLLKDLQDKKILKLLPLLQVNQSNIDETLSNIFTFLTKWNEKLHKGMSFCNLNSESYHSIWQKLSHENNITEMDESNFKRYNFFNFKIILFSQWAIQERYLDLGFIFDTATNETIIPALLDSPEEEYIEDFTSASTQMLDSKNIEDKNENKHEVDSPLIYIPEDKRSFNKYL
ncbi:uncharacterized protein LOC126902739 [Daktulosphaira vitifoliae]|uniref:uncharacterized protein LOC126902739 n=1 Tax=Daktulosphaira vitifoliae TaxID=58002 RepID=UPI0021A9A475|nr:uncharacterized protein LOC126902739 [Daktulosphaira vitifoliae]